jgi:hypothetical protein
MHISMKADIKQATAKLRGAQRKQIPFATAKALTNTAWDVAKEEKRQLPMKLDRPTPFTLRAFGVKRATKNRLVATVFIKPIQAAYLGFQIRGGIRKPSGRAIGVPVNQRLNRYGNMTRGKIKALLAKPDHFSGTINGVGGIYQRQKKGGVKLIVAWEPRTNYTAGRFPFYKIGVGKARAVMARNMRKAIDYALRSAK